ncbi:DeoR/GlpR family DNA-binding transcription regulator [Cohnella sp. JJ-181]|uniref:DeoR/GlpR family DNA-binding transcription regulator n=1 Tax=Cohnella rhizoplanae TaxID=2974897 RepID=UPI0022FF51A3|nr:DeoR/GlpR family DNA-binding transcription regulator [Cohnella sp. JJ-181]CAI6061513.1 Glucitol operon repressor [Cohnella sp. JJ-181]
MLPLQRKQLLIDYLADKGVATMREMSDRFGVSEMTIRRDLNALEQENVIRRSHGGAVYLGTRTESTGQDEPELTDKQAHNRDVKERLAEYAARKFVNDGDIVALENGTTVSFMVDRLGHFNELTLLTNGLDTLTRFRPYAGDRRSAISCGGILREKSGTFVGPLAEEFFSRYHADTLFLSALGFTPEAGFTDPNLLDTQVKISMIRASRRVVMLLDSSKIGKRFFAPVAALTDIDVFVTDEGISRDDRELIESGGVELHIV